MMISSWSSSITIGNYGSTEVINRSAKGASFHNKLYYLKKKLLAIIFIFLFSAITLNTHLFTQITFHIIIENTQTITVPTQTIVLDFLDATVRLSGTTFQR